MGAYKSPGGALPVGWISFGEYLSDRRQAVLTRKKSTYRVMKQSTNGRDFRTVGKVVIELSSEYTGSKVKQVSTAGIVLQQAEVKEEVLTLNVSRYAPGACLLQLHDGKVVKLIKE